MILNRVGLSSLAAGSSLLVCSSQQPAASSQKPAARSQQREASSQKPAANTNSLQPLQRQASINMNDTAGGVRQVASQQRTYRAADIIRLTPASFRDEPINNAAVVQILDRCRHVGGDD